MKNLIFISFLSPFMAIFFPSKPTYIRPPNTVEIVDNFFFDQTEIGNSDWREYLDKLKEVHGENSTIYKNALPSNLILSEQGDSMAVFAETYFQHPSYNNYPVVGISHEQAKAYCIWRTKVVKKMMMSFGNEAGNFEYRLPTRTEWELVANAGYSEKQKKLILKKNKKHNGKARTCNMIFDDDNDKAVRMTQPSRNYLPNKYDVYSIYGNVAEMVAEPNIAMGGSFRDKYENIVPANKALNYEGPQVWLGFRCVAEFFD